MKVFHLKEHSYSCPCNEPHEHRENFITDNFYQNLIYKNRYNCEKNPSRFIFQMDGDFYMIVYYECVTLSDYSGYFTELLQKAIAGLKEKRLSLVKKSRPLNDVLNDIKRGDFSFKNYHEEIMHIYDGSFKVPEYCITRKTDYFNEFFSSKQFTENYHKALDYLKSQDIHEVYIDELHRLYNLNRIIDYAHDKTIIQSTNKLIEQINKIANGND
jgi:hypothetical protein